MSKTRAKISDSAALSTFVNFAVPVLVVAPILATGISFDDGDFAHYVQLSIAY